MKDRRTFLKGIASVAALNSAGMPALGAIPRQNTSSGGRLSKSAKARKRRIVWNNDGSDMLAPAYSRGTWPIPLKSSDHFIDSLTRFLVGTEVDAIFYCAHVNEPDWEIPSKNIEVLGKNPSKPVVDFAHKHGMEFFYSIRMNDTHAAYFPPSPSYWPPFRLKHPELLLANVSREEFEKKYLPWIKRYVSTSSAHEQSSDRQRQAVEEHPLADLIKRQGLASRDLWSWPAYNYAHPEVRTRYLEIVKGACQRYDLEGIELDWVRMPLFFKLGEERRNIPVMNDFVHQVHQCLDEHGKKRGRTILLAMRVPDTIELCLSVGLDPVTWAREGWVDLFMAGSGLMPFSVPIADWVKLGHEHGIQVYGCLDRIHPLFRTGRPKFDTRDPDIVNDTLANYDAVRAAAYRFWREGADGIYLYDWHTHHGPTDKRDYGSVPKVGDAQSLARANKLYQIDPDFPVRPGQGALANACLPGQVPRAFTTQSGPATAAFHLDVVDNPNSAAKLVLLTQWKQGTDPKRVQWQLNDVSIAKESVLTKGKEWLDLEAGFPPGVNVSGGSEEPWTGYNIPRGILKIGSNKFQVTVQPPEQENQAKVVELLQMRLSITYS